MIPLRIFFEDYSRSLAGQDGVQGRNLWLGAQVYAPLPLTRLVTAIFSEI